MNAGRGQLNNGLQIQSEGSTGQCVCIGMEAGVCWRRLPVNGPAMHACTSKWRAAGGGLTPKTSMLQPLSGADGWSGLHPHPRGLLPDNPQTLHFAINLSVAGALAGFRPPPRIKPAQVGDSATGQAWAAVKEWIGMATGCDWGSGHAGLTMICRAVASSLFEDVYLVFIHHHVFVRVFALWRPDCRLTILAVSCV